MKNKMNFASAEKMCSLVVIEQLNKEIPQSEGSVAYLKLMNYVKSSFLDSSTVLRIRLYRIWYVVFFTRIWRAWREYKTSENFLTSNCYLCIEMNAHALIKLILKIKNSELRPEMLSIGILGSQACESLFRSARSMTSTYSTVINFSIKNMPNRIERISTINDAINDLRGTFDFQEKTKD